MDKVTDIIINGNGFRDIYTAVYYAKMGKSVILVTDGEYLFKEAAECLGGFFEENSLASETLDYLEIPYRKPDNSLCHIPQGDASMYAMKTLLKYGVYILFDTVKIGDLKKNDNIYGGVFANKFGVFGIEAKNVIEYVKSSKHSFSFQLSNLKLDGIKTPLIIEDINGLKNIILNRDSKETNTAVISFDRDNDSMYTAFEDMLGIVRYLREYNPLFKDCVLQKTAYSTDDYRIYDMTVKDTDDSFSKPDTMEISGKKFDLKDFVSANSLDESLPFDTYMIEPSADMAETVSTSALVSGAGTGGVCAYMALKDEGTDDVIILDRAHLPGGTRTLGMVYAFWYGYQDGFAKENKKNISMYLDKVLPGIGCRDYTGELLYYVNTLKDNCRYTTYLCGAKKDGHKIDGVFAASKGKFTYIRSDFYIDATGDADVAVFAGCKYRECGDIRDGFPQSFSIWGETEQGKKWSESIYHGDEENISTEKYSEYVRGIIASDSVNSPDGYSPILTVRESRSVAGEYVLNLKDILSEKIFDDTISVSKIYYDAHGNGTSRAYYTRLYDALLTKTKGDPIRVRLPYRALIPEGITNLLVVSKSISATRDAAGMVRMNPDIQNTAYSAGIIVSHMIRDNISDTRMAYDEYIKDKLIAKEILPKWTFTNEDKPLIESIRQKDMLYLAKASLDDKNIPCLTEAFKNETDEEIKYFYASALLGLKSEVPYSYMLDKLKCMIKTSDDILKNSADIMSIIILISYVKTKDNKLKEEFMKSLGILLDNITSGGERDFSEQSVYAGTKIHATTVRNYKLLLALVYVCEENADKIFIPYIRNLIKKDGIMIDKNSDVFSQHLYMRYLSVLYRLGDTEVTDEFKKYLTDKHYFFRTFVKKELDEIKTFPDSVTKEWDLWI